MIEPAAIERAIAAAGYDSETPLAVGARLGQSTPVIVSHGRGQDGSALAADDQTYAGSLAKQVTGVCAAILVESGLLEVETPVDLWLRDLPDWSQTVRVRHLIHHTAGLPGTDAVWQRMELQGARDWTSDGVLRALATMDSLLDGPGTAYAYSNVGYVCLARILERLTGMDRALFAHEHLFGPLGMTGTSLLTSPGPTPPSAASGEPFQHPAPLSVGDGGLWTTVRDLLRWNDALLTDELGITARVHTPGTLDDGTPLDYAWGVRVALVEGEQLQSHGGNWDGVTAKLVRLPDRDAGFAVLALDGSVERMVALSAALQEELVAAGA